MFSGFMTNAWIVATIVAVIAGVVGFFVVLRGDAFPAHAIPNGAFAGAAGAALVTLAAVGCAVADSVAEAEAGCAAVDSLAFAAAGLLFASSSATRFSSCSMRSSIQRSRSVSGVGESTLAVAGFAGESLLGDAAFAGVLLESLSSASRRFELMPVNSNAARRISNCLPKCLNARISFS